MRGKAKSNAAGENFGKKRKGFAHQFFVSKSIGARTEVDVRGMTMDEAIPAVDKAMDDALLAGLTSLRHYSRQRHRRFKGRAYGLPFNPRFGKIACGSTA